MTIGFVIWLLDLVWLIVIIAIIAILLGSGFFFLAIWTRYEVMLEQRAKRKEQDAKAERAHKDANITVVKAGEKIFIADELHLDWRADHLIMSAYRNGSYQEPTPLEIEAFNRFHKPQIIKGDYKQLEAPVELTTFYEVMNQYPHLLIVGSTGSGKTTQLNLAISYRLSQYPDAYVVWLSTHANLDNPHPKAEVHQDIHSIMATFKEVFLEYQYRRDTAEIGKHIIVALDEWPELVDEIKGLGGILRRLSRGGRKCAISLILASHGSNVTDLDIKGHSSVKQDFAEIILSPKMTKEGKAIWQQYNKVSSQIEIELPKRRDAAQMLIASGESKNTASKTFYAGRNYGGDLVSKF